MRGYKPGRCLISYAFRLVSYMVSWSLEKRDMCQFNLGISFLRFKFSITAHVVYIVVTAARAHIVIVPVSDLGGGGGGGGAM